MWWIVVSTGWVGHFMPGDLKSDMPMEQEGCALVAAVLRLQDDIKFQNECVEWFDKRRRRRG